MTSHYTHQLSDADPVEMQEWMDSLDALLGSSGKERARFLIGRLVRWNAAVMVIRANKFYEGIGGHLSTFASSASLYEVGFNRYL